MRGSGGSPFRSQPPSVRRSISLRAISWPSAVVTDGRRAPTIPASVRWGRRRLTTTPPGTTRPQRSARHHSSASRRSSTRVRWAIACMTTSRSARRAARSTSAAKISGHCAARTASAWSITASRECASAVHSTERGSSTSASRSSHARSRSPGPSSSAHGWSPTVASRTSSPSSTSRPIGWLPCASARPGVHGPRGTSMARTNRRWLTSLIRRGSSPRARSGSASRSCTEPLPASGMPRPSQFRYGLSAGSDLVGAVRLEEHGRTLRNTPAAPRPIRRVARQPADVR